MASVFLDKSSIKPEINIWQSFVSYTVQGEIIEKFRSDTAVADVFEIEEKHIMQL